MPLATKFNHIKEWNQFFGMQGFISSWRLGLGKQYLDFFFVLLSSSKKCTVFNFLCRSAVLINTERRTVTLAAAPVSWLLTTAQLRAGKRQRTAVASGGYRLVLCWKLRLLVVSAVNYNPQVHETRGQLFTWFQLDPRDRTQKQRTPTESVSRKTLHKLIILTSTPDFVLTLLSALSVFFVEDFCFRIKNFESWVLVQF